MVRRDAYAGADLDNAQRFGSVLWSVSLLVAVVLAFVYPPTAAIGDAGWTVFWVTIAVSAAALVVVLRRPTWNLLLGASYFGALELACNQWLSGGYDVPLDELFLPLLVATALAHPPRRFVPFAVLVVGLTFAPALYGETGGSLDDTIVAAPLSLMVAAFAGSVMVRVRRQRVLLADGRRSAEDEARRDELTGLENRRAFEETVAAALAAGRAAGSPLALAIGDVDGFKAVNDRHGHLAGDGCLRAVAAALRGAARSTDRVFRWGGDEFAVLLAGADAAEVQAACERLEAAVAGAGSSGVRVSLSLGWAQDGGTGGAEALVAAADAALLERKRARRRLPHAA